MRSWLLQAVAMPQGPSEILTSRVLAGLIHQPDPVLREIFSVIKSGNENRRKDPDTDNRDGLLDNYPWDEIRE